jgi:hypothetical protein
LKKLAPLLIVFSLFVQAFAFYTLIKRVEPFMYWFYLMVWWSFIIFVDAALCLKKGRSTLFNRRLPWLATVSCGLWSLFELENVRLQNWFYINVPPAMGLRFSGYFLAFATVIPAIYLTTEAIGSILPPLAIRPIPLKRYGTYAIPLGIFCFALSVAFPLYCFSLAWVFLLFIIDGYNYRKGYPSFGRELEKGSLTRIVSVAAAGLICGILWEFWNYWAVTKWIYAVPFFETFKLFEMPAPGFLGFPLFALETMAFLALMDSGPLTARSRWVVCVITLGFCLAVFSLIDRYTVFSQVALVDELPFLSENTKKDLENRGIETSYAIDPALLGQSERESLALIDLKGLGLHHFNLLQAHGVHTVERLSQIDQHELSAMLKEPNLRRIRVFMTAAREYGSNPGH